MRQQNNVEFSFFLNSFIRRPLSYRNQSIDLLCKSIDWFLYHRDLRQVIAEAWLIIWRYQFRSGRLVVLCKKVLLKISQSTEKGLCWSLFFNKGAGWRLATLLKTDSNRGIFLWILAKFLRTSILKNTNRRLFLSVVNPSQLRV